MKLCTYSDIETLTNIQGLHFNFNRCESFLELNSPDILALCGTNCDDTIDSSNFSVKNYLPFIQKDSVTYVHGLAVYVKEGLPFAGNLSLKNSVGQNLKNGWEGGGGVGNIGGLHKIGGFGPFYQL